MIICIRMLLTLLLCHALWCCTPSTQQEDTTFNDSASDVYARMDSTLRIGDRSFQVSVTQYDLTEKAIQHNDTLERPTYGYVLQITDRNQKVLLKDFILRNSWGYKGRIVPIEYYTLAFPQLHLTDSEIILSFYLSEEEDGDTMLASISLNVTNDKVRYFYEEAILEE